MIQSPPGFIVAEERRKAAWDNGYRLDRGERDGWAQFGSTTARGQIHLAAAGDHGPWFLALEDPAAVAGLALAPIDVSGPGVARYAFADLAPLYRALSQVYALSCGPTPAPEPSPSVLAAFRHVTRGMPQTTAAERLATQRIGQDLFRGGLLRAWGERCPLTDISDRALLRASHIIPWADCADDAERLDLDNGLLLSALWDAAFDRGLVSFGDDGAPMFSPSLSDAARAELRWRRPLTLNEGRRERLARHRETIFSAD